MFSCKKASKVLFLVTKVILFCVLMLEASSDGNLCVIRMVLEIGVKMLQMKQLRSEWRAFLRVSKDLL